VFRQLLAFLIMTVGCWIQNASADTLKYYRHLVFRESPVEDYEGRYEIDADVAKRSLHFRFRYYHFGTVGRDFKSRGKRFDSISR